MTTESPRLTRQDFELRGWKEICEFLGCRDKETARKRLKRRGLLVYDGAKPILSPMLYKAVSEKVDIHKYKKVPRRVIENLVLKLIDELVPPQKKLVTDAILIPQLPNQNKEQSIERGHKQYLRWRSDILNRDGYKCRYCGVKEYLHVHHIEFFSKNKMLRAELTNGITLCVSCHREVHFKTKGVKHE